MAEGEIAAVFRALAKDAAETARNVADSVAKLTEKTAETEESNLAAILEADAKAADNIAAAGKRRTPAGESGGPPWPVSGDVVGPARGKYLAPPHRRHTIAGARNGQVKSNNTVVLRGNEGAVTEDVRQIAAGRARFVKELQAYEINGRTYRVEPNGTVFPVSGTGLVNLDRNEYLALREITRADGDPTRVGVFTRDPRFVNNPEAIAKAKAIYDGTFPG
jgi:hypothetical protein